MKFLPRVCDPSLFSRLPGTQFSVSMVHSEYGICFNQHRIEQTPLQIYNARNYMYIFSFDMGISRWKLMVIFKYNCIGSDNPFV
jgi:hypothetical protein